MAVQVEIEGRSPNTIIDVGERRIVERTSLVNNLVRGGFATLVRFVPPERAAVVPPLAGDRKAAWQEFLTSQGLKFNADDTKAKLIEHWETRE